MSLSGNLEKWTNYWLGWQTRYFILDAGILSYYQNEEEVEAGAKVRDIFFAVTSKLARISQEQTNDEIV